MIGILWEYLFSLFDVLILIAFADLSLNKKEIKIYKQVIYLFITAYIIFALSFARVFSYLSEIMILGVAILYLVLFYFGTIYQKIILGFLFQLLYSCYSVVLIYLVSFFFPNFTEYLYQYNSPQRIGFIVLTRGFVYLLLLILGHKRKKEESEELSFIFSSHVFYILFTCAIILLVVINMIVSGDFKANNDAYFLFIGLVCLFLTAIIMEKKFFENKIEIEKLQAKAQALEMQTIYYETKHDQEDEIRRVKHDLKNSLITMQMLLREQKYEEAQSFINDLTQLPAFKKNIVTGNDTLDALFNINMQTNPEIHFVIDIQICELPINKVSLATIVGNALNNAIEATKMVKNSSDRKISVSIIEDSKRIIMKFVNPYEKEPVLKSGGLVSIKEDKENHGLGIISIKKEASKYKGKVHYEIDKKEKMFYLKVLLLK